MDMEKNLSFASSLSGLCASLSRQAELQKIFVGFDLDQ
jgi:hypothetical protein